MKQIIFIFSLLFVSFCMKGQTTERQLTYAATVGTGIALNEPSYTLFSWQVLGYYHISKRFSAGVGTGLSFYETMLMPVVVDAKFAVTRPHKVTPYLECSSGYAFALHKNANGGFYLNPSVGIQYALFCKIQLQLAAGYELQQSEQLKRYANDYFTSEFAEKRSHHSLSIKLGVLF